MCGSRVSQRQSHPCQSQSQAETSAGALVACVCVRGGSLLSQSLTFVLTLSVCVVFLFRPSIDVDLLAASEVAWLKKTDHHARRTVFGQLFQQRSKLPSIHFRLVRSARAFTVNYVGMRATDAGGPYRDSIERMGNELQSPLLPLFIKVPNCVYTNSGDDSTSSSGGTSGQDLFVPRPSSTSAAHLSMYTFVGKLMGLSVRTKNLWNLTLPSMIWKTLVKEELDDSDIRAIDALAFSQLERMTAIAKALATAQQEQAGSTSSSSAAASSSSSSSAPTSSTAVSSSSIDPRTLSSLLSPSIHFTILDSEGRVQPLCEGGHSLPVDASNFARYVSLTRSFRLNEFRVQCLAMQRGLASVIPASVLSLLTWRELESLVCGRGLGVEDIDLLEKMSKYSGCTRNDRHVDLFWRMLRTRFTDEQRAQFLTFTYGRSRLPTSSADVDTSFTIMRAQTRSLPSGPLTAARLAASIDRQLPSSHTCGFALELPAYSSLDIMVERVLYAINHCSEVDADGGMARTGNYRVEEEEEEEEQRPSYF